jgi:radical SAM protein with 4Fe4S-binding SPASM domain
MNYMATLYHSFYEFHHRHIKLSTLPQITTIEVTNACNLACPMCSRDAIIRQRGLGFMKFADFKAVVDKYHMQMFHVRLFLHGESTLHPNLPEMVAYLNDYRGKNVRSIGLTTNGVLVSADYFRRLVDAGLDNIEFSFEGIDKQTYESIRVGANFEQVKYHIRDACAINTERGIDVGINIIDMKQTHDRLPEFVSEWSKVEGLSRIDFGTLHDWNETLNVDRFGGSSFSTEYAPRIVSVCPAPWFTALIHWNLTVVPCCRWLSKPFGNILEQDLAEIWNCIEMVELRKTMLKGRQHHSYCRTCAYNPFTKGSPYLVKPSKFYPFTLSFLKSIFTYRKVTNKTYRPSRSGVETVD